MAERDALRSQADSLMALVVEQAEEIELLQQSNAEQRVAYEHLYNERQ